MREKLHKTVIGRLTAASVLLVCSCINTQAQATFNVSGIYTQNFGTTAQATWTDNSTFTGWYAYLGSGPGTFAGTINITAAAPVNTGAVYMYQCNSDGNMKLGTRPSNTAAGGPHHPQQDNTDGMAIGVRIKNNTGSTITSIQVSYDWFQLSLAENEDTVNTNYFDYQLGSPTITSLTAGAWTNVASLDWTAPIDNNDGGNSAQLNGYPCTTVAGCGTGTAGTKTACIAVSIPANTEIMLRWYDPNDANNDPHMAIDNVEVIANFNTTCSSELPITLIEFNAIYNSSVGVVNIEWSTASEVNNRLFTIEKTSDGKTWSSVTSVEGAGNSTHNLYYSAIDESPSYGVSYYRLKQADYDGRYTYSDVVPVSIQEKETDISVAPNSANNYTVVSFKSPVQGYASINIYDWAGRLVDTKSISMTGGLTTIMLSTATYKNGMYFISVNNTSQQLTAKLVINHE